MEKPSKKNIFIAKCFSKVVDGDTKIERFCDEKRESNVDILTSKNAPNDGLNTYATIGLSDANLYFDGHLLKLKAEFIAIGGDDFHRLDNALATAVFCILNTKWEVYPGAIFDDVLNLVGASKVLKHLFFVEPYSYDGLLSFEYEGEIIGLLQGIPINDAERSYALKNGPKPLELKLQNINAEIFNKNRKTVV